MKANVRPPKLDADNPTICRSQRTRTADQILSSHQGGRRTGLDCAPSTLPREMYPRLAGVPRPTLLPNISQVLSLYPLATGTAHLLLQHVTSPPAATYSDRSCPYRHQQRPPYCLLYRVRDMWHQSIGPIAPASLRPTHPSGALGSRPSWVAPSTQARERHL
ncbi:hypothetical protein TIFTF001_018528 [Ficus carica]|uniref:Uncharacterized protein n=1 Tax=Ficus carica TaxID=3494 RepID=A0AA88AB79_FICCA|nr:hypothetical protein TIFTF001_018528 [Ficus carica]